MSQLRGAAVLVLLAGSVLLRADVAASTACTGAEAALESVATALDEGLWSDAEAALQALGKSHPDCSGVVVNLSPVLFFGRSAGSGEESTRRSSPASVKEQSSSARWVGLSFLPRAGAM